MKVIRQTNRKCARLYVATFINISYNLAIVFLQNLIANCSTHPRTQIYIPLLTHIGWSDVTAIYDLCVVGQHVV